MKKIYIILTILAAFALTAEVVTIPLMANSQQNLVSNTANEKIQSVSLSPVLAAVISCIIPGLGQIMLGKTKRGIYFLIAAVLTWTFTVLTGGLLCCLSLVVSGWAAYDAYKIAKSGSSDDSEGNDEEDDDALLNFGITPVSILR